ncbi:Enteropeptidase [Lamellibrachia satsuma]|nr:Enteropeptidase [Lamellibrachia satsuma]
MRVAVSCGGCGDVMTLSGGSPWDADELDVVLGMFNTSDESEPSQRKIGVTNWFIHPDYDTSLYKNDIALVHLSEDVRYSPQISPICLPTEDVAANTMCVVTGWGKTAVDWPDVLHQVKLPIVDQEVCRQPGWHGSNITDSMLCAGFPEGGKDTCSSDSGGPLVCKNGRKWVLHGITSWGKGECGSPNSPGVYTRVTRFMKWMESVMSAN